MRLVFLVAIVIVFFFGACGRDTETKSRTPEKVVAAWEQDCRRWPDRPVGENAAGDPQRQADEFAGTIQRRRCGAGVVQGGSHALYACRFGRRCVTPWVLVVRGRFGSTASQRRVWGADLLS